jgi:hypothetical protein
MTRGTRLGGETARRREWMADLKKQQRWYANPQTGVLVGGAAETKY